MIKRLVHAVDIDAGPERVWQILTDLSAYPQWNPFIVRAEGSVDVGTSLVLRMQPRHTLPAFAAMNAALKARAEQAMTPSP